MGDVIAEIITSKDTIKFYFDSYGAASNFVDIAIHAAFNEDPERIIKFCIHADNEPEIKEMP